MHQAERVFFLMLAKKIMRLWRSTVSNWIEPYSAMNNSKLFVSAICLLVLTLAAPLTTEAGRGGVAVVVEAAVAALAAAECHAAAFAAECHAAASLVAEWARAARVGAVLTGTGLERRQLERRSQLERQ